MADQNIKITGEFIDKISPALEKLSGQSLPLLQSALAGVAGGAAVALFEGIARAIGSVASAIPNMTAAAIDAADEMGKLAQRTGLAFEELQQFKLAAALSDVSAGDMAKSLRKLNEELATAGADSGSKAAAIFRELGINVKDTNGKLISGADALLQISDRFKDSEDSALKSNLAMELGSRALVNMIPLLNQGSASVREFNKAQEGMGINWTAEQAKQAEDYNDSLTLIKASFTAIGDIIAKDILPYFVEWAKYLAESAKEGGTLNLVIKGMADVLVFLLGFLDPLIVGFTTLATVIKVTGMQIGAFSAALVAVLRGDFAAAKTILKEMEADTKQAYLDLADVIAKTRDPKAPSKSGEKKTGVLPDTKEIENNIKLTEEYSKWLAKIDGQFADIESKRTKARETASIQENAAYISEKEQRAGYVAAEMQRIEVMEKANKLRAEANQLTGGNREKALRSIDAYEAQYQPGGDAYEKAKQTGEAIVKMDVAAKSWNDTVNKVKDAQKDLNIQQEQYNLMLKQGAITQEQYTKFMRDNARAQEDLASSQTIAGQAFNEYVTKNRRSMEDTVQKMAALRDANSKGTMSAAEYTKSMNDLQKSYDDLNPTFAINQIDKINDEIKKTTSSFEGMFADYIFDAMQGKWGNLADTVKKSIDRMVANMLAAKIQMALFGDMGSTPTGKTASSTGLLGGLFGSIFGMREGGGPVSAGMPYIVGEKRPEIFVPSTNGNIMPDASAFGGNTSITINAIDTQSFNQALSKDPRYLTQLVLGAQRKYGITGN